MSMYNYTFKPNPLFHRAGNEGAMRRMYGIELEGCLPHGVAERSQVVDLSDKFDAITGGVDDHAYCKYDCSVDIELVTHPMSLRYHMNNFRWKYVCQTAVKNGFRSHHGSRSCGLHIHVGREQLGADSTKRDITARKLTVLVKRYWDEITRFSRRESADLDHWAHSPNIMYNPAWSGDEVRVAMRSYSVYSGDRYVGLNPNNSATLEFRMFRGTYERDIIIASLQFVDNLCEYAMTHTWDEIQASTWSEVAQCQHWNELDAYLIAMGLAELDVPRPSNRRTPVFTGVDGIAPATA